MQLRTPTSFTILNYLSEHSLGTPRLINEEVPKSRDYIKQQLGNLHDYGMVERVDRGVYRITERGRIALEHEDEYPSEQFEKAILSV